MILTPEDKATYFPSVCTEGASLQGLIRLTESIAQSYEGAGRNLEITQYNETKGISAFDQSLLLSYWPIIPGSVSVKAERVGGVDSFGRKVSNGSSVLVSADFTIEDQKLYINNPQFVRRFSVTYQAGFDFTQDNQDTRTIKSSLGALLEYRQSFVGQGLTRHDGLGLSLASAPVGQNPENLMSVFRQYKPRG